MGFVYLCGKKKGEGNQNEKGFLGNVSCGGKSPEGLVDVRSRLDSNTVFLDTAWTLNAADLGQLKRIRACSEYGGTMSPQQLLSL